MNADLDPLIHAQGRLRIMAALAVLRAGDEISFPLLQELTELTPGNLSTHLRRLEEAGYLTQHKTFTGRTPATYLRLTPEGRIAFDIYSLTITKMLNP